MQMNRAVIAGICLEEGICTASPFRHSCGQCPRGRERPTRGWQRETRELTNWHSLSFYGKLADVAQALKKGDNVYVDGRIEQRQFIARDGNKPRTVHEIVVSQCHVIAPVRRGNKAADTAAGKNAANRSMSAGAGVEDDGPVAG